MKKIIDIENFATGTINNMLMTNRSGRRFYTKEYREFKELLFHSCMKAKVSPPYQVAVFIRTAHDVDNIVKPILDSMKDKNVIVDDKMVWQTKVLKQPIKKGSLSNRLTVWVGPFDQDEFWNGIKR